MLQLFHHRERKVSVMIRVMLPVEAQIGEYKVEMFARSFLVIKHINMRTIVREL